MSMWAENQEVKQIPRGKNALLHFLFLFLLKLLPALLLAPAVNIPACAKQHTNGPFYMGSSIPQGLVEWRAIVLLRVGEHT